MNQVLALSGCSDYPLSLKGDNQHLSWQWLDDGVLSIKPSTNQSDDVAQKRVLISTGVHGNETAPIEMVAHIICLLLNGQLPIKVNLLVVFGNINAIKVGKRYVDADLNRMFNGRHNKYPSSIESNRAAILEQHVLHFFSPKFSATQHFHFDLHTAIRGSIHEKFGLLPQQLSLQNREYVDWLAEMGLEAIVLNLVPSGTFSSFTSNCCTALSCTLELGKATPFGSNNLANFSQINKALIKLISGEQSGDVAETKPTIYLVQKELTKLTEQFKFVSVDDNVKNFSKYQKGTLIAVDDKVSYRVNDEFEWILFPNASVRSGLRAGLLLTKGNVENLLIDQIAL